MQLLTAVLAVFPASILAINGRCSSNYSWCICLDQNVCRNKWGGTPVQGSPGNWPCPNDPDNVWGCEVSFCKGIDTWCGWRSECTARKLSILPGKRTLAFTFAHCLVN